MSVFKAAAVQMRSGTSPERNAAAMEKLVREAAQQGATYVQTPEMTGALIRDKQAGAAAFTSEDKDVVVSTARKLAQELGIFLHVGSTAILRADGKLANRAFLFAPDGAMITNYDKIHMFDVDLDNGESWR
ncbi:MAG: carbon-nitrogen hydrolase family protein, partial [Mesorhizobium sp.]